MVMKMSKQNNKFRMGNGSNSEVMVIIDSLKYYWHYSLPSLTALLLLLVLQVPIFFLFTFLFHIFHHILRLRGAVASTLGYESASLDSSPGLSNRRTGHPPVHPCT